VKPRSSERGVVTHTVAMAHATPWKTHFHFRAAAKKVKTALGEVD